MLDDVAEQFANLFKVIQKNRNFFELRVDFDEKAFYNMLNAIARKYKFDYAEDRWIALSQAVKKRVDDIKAELKGDLIFILAEHGYPPVPKDEVFKEIFEQADIFKKYS